MSPVRLWTVWGVWDNYGVSTWGTADSRSSAINDTSQSVSYINGALDTHIKTHAAAVRSSSASSSDTDVGDVGERLHIPCWPVNKDPLCYTSPVPKALAKLRARAERTHRAPSSNKLTDHEGQTQSTCPWVVCARARRSRRIQVATERRSAVIMTAPVTKHPPLAHIQHMPVGVSGTSIFQRKRLHVREDPLPWTTPSKAHGRVPTASNPWTLGTYTAEQLERWIISAYGNCAGDNTSASTNVPVTRQESVVSIVRMLVTCGDAVRDWRKRYAAEGADLLGPSLHMPARGSYDEMSVRLHTPAQLRHVLRKQCRVYANVLLKFARAKDAPSLQQTLAWTIPCTSRRWWRTCTNSLLDKGVYLEIEQQALRDGVTGVAKSSVQRAHEKHKNAASQSTPAFEQLLKEQVGTCIATYHVDPQSETGHLVRKVSQRGPLSHEHMGSSQPPRGQTEVLCFADGHCTGSRHWPCRRRDGQGSGGLHGCRAHRNVPDSTSFAKNRGSCKTPRPNI